MTAIRFSLEGVSPLLDRLQSPTRGASRQLRAGAGLLRDVVPHDLEIVARELVSQPAPDGPPGRICGRALPCALALLGFVYQVIYDLSHNETCVG